jgi:hypothetical protein
MARYKEPELLSSGRAVCWIQECWVSYNDKVYVVGLKAVSPTSPLYGVHLRQEMEEQRIITPEDKALGWDLWFDGTMLAIGEALPNNTSEQRPLQMTHRKSSSCIVC